MSDEKGRGDGADPIRICLVGDSGVGKTSLAVRFARDEFHGYVGPASVGGTTPFSKDVWIKGDGKKLTLVETQVWDTFAGDEEPRSMAGTPIEAADGILLLYDLSNYRSFSNVSSWLAAIENNAREDCLIMLVGNKGDLPENDRAVSTSAGSGLAKERGMAYVETSALTGKSVEAAFRLMAQECHDVRRITSGKEIKPKKKRKKKKKKAKANDENNANQKEKSSKKEEKRVRVKIPETDRSNAGSGCSGMGGSPLAGRTASALLAARVQARHERYKRKGKVLDTIGADLETISEKSNESSSVGPSPDVLAATRKEYEARDEEDDEEGGEGRPSDAAAAIEEGLGTLVQTELVPGGDERSIQSGAFDHGNSGNIHPLADGVCAPSPEETKGCINGVNKIGVDLETVTEGKDESISAGPSLDVLAAARRERKAGDEEDGEEGGGGRSYDAAAEIEEGFGTRGQSELDPDEDQRSIPSCAFDHGDSDNVHPLADGVCAPSHEETQGCIQASPTNEAPRVSDDGPPPAKDGAPIESKEGGRVDAMIGPALIEIIHDAQGSPLEIVEAAGSSALSRLADALGDDGSDASDANKILQYHAQSTSSAQPTASSSAPTADLKNATIDEPFQSARDDELGGASPAIARSTPGEGERESKMPANDAASRNEGTEVDANRILQYHAQSTSSAQPTASSSASPPDLKNATIDEPIQSVRDEELGAASPAIAGATPVEGERELKMPANDAASRANEGTEAKSTGPPRWRRHRCIFAFLLTILILVAGAAAVWVVFAPRPTDTAPSSINVVVLPPSASPSVSVSIISETSKPTVGPTAEHLTDPFELASKAPSRVSFQPTARPSTNWPTSGPSELTNKTPPSRASLQPTARPSTNWPTSGPSELTSETSTKRPTTKRPTVKPMTPSPTRSPSKVTFDRSNPTRSPAKDFDPIICAIDRGWRVQVGDDLRGCYWVGRLPGKRCDDSISTKGVPAAVGCPEQCNPDCRPDGS